MRSAPTSPMPGSSFATDSGASEVDGRVAALAEHFGVPLVIPEAEDGVVRLDQTELEFDGRDRHPAHDLARHDAR